MNKAILKILIAVFIFLGGYFVIAQILDRKSQQSVEISYQPKIPNITPDTNIKVDEILPPAQTVISEDEEGQKKNQTNGLIKLEVPFVVQAPFGNWDDPVFQDACEEASIVMAMSWARGISSISPEEAQKQIQEIADFENSTFSYNTNADVFDVQKIIQQFFQHSKVAVYENISLEYIENELQKGNIILAPAFGQALKNPNYTSPGPVTHMLLIIGYDPATQEFITHDPGTRRGSGFRYDKNVLFEAIWAYPSGNDKLQPPFGSRKKSMVVVEKL